jgi:uncharacterized protein (TIGR02453 family)
MSFDGFPRAGLDFLADLEVNNERPWFEAHKDVYTSALLEPAVTFVTAVGERLQNEISTNIIFDTKTNGSGSLMRIYRDIRLSKDKTPYHTFLSGLFWEKPGKKNTRPGFGFRLRADGMDLVGGMFGFDKKGMEQYRTAVLDDELGHELAAILGGLVKDGRYSINGDQYRNVPRGYDPEHPRAGLLKYKGMYAHPVPFNRDVVCSADLVEETMARFKEMAPLAHWLVKAGL